MARVDVFLVEELAAGDVVDLYKTWQSANRPHSSGSIKSIDYFFHLVSGSRHSIVLSDEENERAGRIRRGVDRLTYSLAHTLLRKKLSEMLGVAPHTLAFQAGANGRPRLVKQAIAPWFSLSYRVGLVAIATSSAPIGVDIEYVDQTIPHRQIARRFFDTSEADMLAALAPDLRLRVFFSLWTRKEALAKAAGMRLQDGLMANVTKRSACLTDEDGIFTRYRLHTLGSRRHCVMSVASEESLLN